jgi:hypothetical protein
VKKFHLANTVNSKTMKQQLIKSILTFCNLHFAIYYSATAQIQQNQNVRVVDTIYTPASYPGNPLPPTSILWLPSSSQQRLFARLLCGRKDVALITKRGLYVLDPTPAGAISLSLHKAGSKRCCWEGKLVDFVAV